MAKLLKNIKFKMDGSFIAVSDLIYPVGSVFIGTDDLEWTPANMFGGTWSQITDRYIRAATTSGTGGASSFTIASGNLPKHTHSVSITSGGPSNNTSGGPSNNTSGGAGGHSHYWTYQVDTNVGNLSGGSYNLPRMGIGTSQSWTNSVGDHTHTLSSHTHSLQSHTHSVSGNTGDGGFAGTAISYDPSYQNLLVWKRTA